MTTISNGKFSTGAIPSWKHLKLIHLIFQVLVWVQRPISAQIWLYQRQKVNLNPGRLFVQQPASQKRDREAHLNYYASAYNRGRQLLWIQNPTSFSTVRRQMRVGRPHWFFQSVGAVSQCSRNRNGNVHHLEVHGPHRQSTSSTCCIQEVRLDLTVSVTNLCIS